MKKIGLFIFLFIVFISKVKASDTFYLGDHVPDIYIYMDRINKKVYRQFRMIYKSDTNELVYCIEPGSTLSTSSYDSYNEYNGIFNLSIDQFNKIKLIAYYGYNYKNHTDIKWYAITQYIIWKEIMPYNWDMYFVDSNYNRLDNQFTSEISEIYALVNNHDSNVGIKEGYIINYKNNLKIKGDNNLSNYSSSMGKIENNTLILNDLKYGRNDINLSFNNYSAPLFYYNSGGQNILKRGDIYNKNINLYVYVTAGKVKINECNEETFEDDFLGGTYEVLNEDDVILGEITCFDNNCISDYLPIGFHKIRVKSLPNNYYVNEHIYDVEIKDTETTDITICSLPKKVITKKVVETNEEPYEYETLEIVENKEENISIPYTSRYSVLKYIIFILTTLSCLLLRCKNENTN